MTCPCFKLLTQRIICFIGEDIFKSEAYINAFFKDKCQKYEVIKKTIGGYIYGEVKLAITLRLLAGGDALNLGTIFDIYSDWCIKLMYEVLIE